MMTSGAETVNRYTNLKQLQRKNERKKEEHVIASLGSSC